MARTEARTTEGQNRGRTQMSRETLTARDIMTPNVTTCREDADLGTAARIMWERDCGVVPVVDGDGRVVGVLTDRDICIAAATRSQSPGEIRAGELIAKPLDTCSPDDTVEEILRVMQRSKVRRLPVVDRDGRLAGMVSLGDVAVRADGRADPELHDEVFQALRAISQPPPSDTPAATA